jgi:hypothetical protein
MSVLCSNSLQILYISGIAAVNCVLGDKFVCTKNVRVGF